MILSALRRCRSLYRITAWSPVVPGYLSNSKSSPSVEWSPQPASQRTIIYNQQDSMISLRSVLYWLHQPVPVCRPTRNLELTFIIHSDTVPVLVRFVDVGTFQYTLVMGSWFIQRVWLDEVSRTTNEQKYVLVVSFCPRSSRWSSSRNRK